MSIVIECVAGDRGESVAWAGRCIASRWRLLLLLVDDILFLIAILDVLHLLVRVFHGIVVHLFILLPFLSVL
jgi:hypothetical protein